MLHSSMHIIYLCIVLVMFIKYLLIFSRFSTKFHDTALIYSAAILSSLFSRKRRHYLRRLRNTGSKVDAAFPHSPAERTVEAFAKQTLIVHIKRINK
jgi:hypothetical protein